MVAVVSVHEGFRAVQSSLRVDHEDDDTALSSLWEAKPKDFYEDAAP